MQNAEKKCALGCTRFSAMCYEAPKMDETLEQRGEAEKLDLDGIRRRVKHRTILTNDLLALLAAVDRVLAIEGRNEFTGTKTDVLIARGWNSRGFAVREALGVRE